MSAEDKKYLTFSIFLTALGIIMALWGTLFGYSFTRLSAVEAKQEIQDTASVEIKTQLSQIQTDLQWIKQAMAKELNQR